MDNEEPAVFCFVSFLLILSAVVITIICTDTHNNTYWQKEAVAHGAANYVIKDNRTMFLWNDEIKIVEKRID